MSLVFRYAQILSHHLFEKELLTPFVISYLFAGVTCAVTSFPCHIIGRVWCLIVSSILLIHFTILYVISIRIRSNSESPPV